MQHSRAAYNIPFSELFTEMNLFPERVAFQNRNKTHTRARATTTTIYNRGTRSVDSASYCVPMPNREPCRYFLYSGNVNLE